MGWLLDAAVGGADLEGFAVRVEAAGVRLFSGATEPEA